MVHQKNRRRGRAQTKRENDRSTLPSGSDLVEHNASIQISPRSSRLQSRLASNSSPPQLAEDIEKDPSSKEDLSHKEEVPTSGKQEAEAETSTSRELQDEAGSTESIKIVEKVVNSQGPKSKKTIEIPDNSSSSSSIPMTLENTVVLHQETTVAPDTLAGLADCDREHSETPPQLKHATADSASETNSNSAAETNSAAERCSLKQADEPLLTSNVNKSSCGFLQNITSDENSSVPNDISRDGSGCNGVNQDAPIQIKQENKLPTSQSVSEAAVRKRKKITKKYGEEFILVTVPKGVSPSQGQHECILCLPGKHFLPKELVFHMQSLQHLKHMLELLDYESFLQRQQNNNPAVFVERLHQILNDDTTRKKVHVVRPDAAEETRSKIKLDIQELREQSRKHWHESRSKTLEKNKSAHTAPVIVADTAAAPVRTAAFEAAAAATTPAPTAPVLVAASVPSTTTTAAAATASAAPVSASPTAGTVDEAPSQSDVTKISDGTLPAKTLGSEQNLANILDTLISKTKTVLEPDQIKQELTSPDGCVTETSTFIAAHSKPGTRSKAQQVVTEANNIASSKLAEPIINALDNKTVLSTQSKKAEEKKTNVSLSFETGSSSQAKNAPEKVEEEQEVMVMLKEPAPPKEPTLIVLDEASGDDDSEPSHQQPVPPKKEFDHVVILGDCNELESSRKWDYKHTTFFDVGNSQLASNLTKLGVMKSSLPRRTLWIFLADMGMVCCPVDAKESICKKANCSWLLTSPLPDYRFVSQASSSSPATELDRKTIQNLVSLRIKAFENALRSFCSGLTRSACIVLLPSMPKRVHCTLRQNPHVSLHNLYDNQPDILFTSGHAANYFRAIRFLNWNWNILAETFHAPYSLKKHIMAFMNIPNDALRVSLTLEDSEKEYSHTYNWYKMVWGLVDTSLGVTPTIPKEMCGTKQYYKASEETMNLIKGRTSSSSSSSSNQLPSSNDVQGPAPTPLFPSAQNIMQMPSSASTKKTEGNFIGEEHSAERIKKPALLPVTAFPCLDISKGFPVFTSNIPKEASVMRMKKIFLAIGELSEYRLETNQEDSTTHLSTTVYQSKQTATTAIRILNKLTVNKHQLNAFSSHVSPSMCELDPCEVVIKFRVFKALDNAGLKFHWDRYDFPTGKKFESDRRGKRSRSPGKIRSRSPSNKTRQNFSQGRSKSPLRGRTRSPLRGRTRSPLRGRTRSPLRGRTRSPLRGRTRSPNRRRTRSPLCRHSKSPPGQFSRNPARKRRRSASRRSMSPSCKRRDSYSPSWKRRSTDGRSSRCSDGSGGVSSEVVSSLPAVPLGTADPITVVLTSTGHCLTRLLATRLLVVELNKLFNGVQAPVYKQSVGWLLKLSDRRQAKLLALVMNNVRLVNTVVTTAPDAASGCEIHIAEEEVEQQRDRIQKCCKEYNNRALTLIREQMNKALDVYTFKIKPCTTQNCPRTRCINYHDDKDRRRSIIMFHYRSEMCPTLMSGESCPDGYSCRYCHTINERLLHFDVFQRTVCSRLSSDGRCTNTDLCIHVHPGTPDMLYHNTWQDLYISGLENSFLFLIGAIRNLYRAKNTSIGLGYKTRVIFITPCSNIARLAHDLITDLAKKHDFTVAPLNTVQGHVAIGSVGALCSHVMSVTHRGFVQLNALVLDDVTGLLSPTHNRTSSRLLFKIFKEIKSRPVNRVVVCSEVHREEIASASKLLNTTFKVISGEAESVAEASKLVPAKRRREDHVRSSRWDPPDPAVIRSQESASHQPAYTPTTSRQYSDIPQTSFGDKQTTSSEGSRLHSRAPPSRSYGGGHHETLHDPGATNVPSSRAPSSDAHARQYISEKESLMRELEDKYRMYAAHPTRHPRCQEFLITFAALPNKHQLDWKAMWNDELDIMKADECKERMVQLIQKYKEMTNQSVKPAAASAPHSGYNHLVPRGDLEIFPVET